MKGKLRRLLEVVLFTLSLIFVPYWLGFIWNKFEPTISPDYIIWELWLFGFLASILLLFIVCLIAKAVCYIIYGD